MWSLENPAVRNGIIAGILSAVVTLVCYLVNARWVFSISGWVSTLVFIAFMIQSVRAHRQTVDLLTFSEALKPAFLTYAVANLVYVVFYYLLFNFIASDLITLQKERAIEMIEKMSGFLGEAGSEKAIEALEEKGFGYGIGTALWTYAWGLILPGFPIAAVMALIMRQSTPRDFA